MIKDWDQIEEEFRPPDCTWWQAQCWRLEIFLLRRVRLLQVLAVALALLAILMKLLWR